MRDKVRRELRNRLKLRIERQDSMAELTTTELTKTLDEYEDLTLRLKDFAFQYAISRPRSQAKWAYLYGVSQSTINGYLMNPRVQKLINELKYDVRKRMIVMQQALIKGAMDQYLEIFATPIIDGPVMEAKRKAAKEVLAWQGIGSNLDEDGNMSQRPVHVNIGGDISHGQGVSRFVPNELTIDDIKMDRLNLEKKQKLRILAEKYGTNGLKIQESES